MARSVCIRESSAPRRSGRAFGVGMTAQLIASIGGGLILLGICFLIMDFFVARLVPKLRRPGVHDLSDQQMLVSVAKPADRRRTKMANLNYEAAVTHRMRRGGLIVIAAGVAFLLGSLAYQLLS
jgi:hypothetical protein